MNLAESLHFSWHELADGVYMAQMKPGGSAASNAGIIDLGDRTILFDTSNTPSSGSDLLAASRTLTGRDPNYVINSHYHGDHVRGNQVFAPKTQIVSTTATRDLMATRGAQQLAEQRATLPQLYAEKQDELARELDATKRRELASQLEFYRPTVESITRLKMRLPNLTFDSRMDIMGEKRAVELVTYGGGHSPSDAILYIPDCEVTFIGDLIFNDLHPYIADGDPAEWVRILDEIAEMPASRFVPGHGDLADQSHLTFMRSYLTGMEHAVREAVEADATFDDVMALPVPDDFAHLTNIAGMYQSTLGFFYSLFVTDEEE